MILDFIIRWGFYLIFFLVPLVLSGDTSELFEFNKMWVTFGLTIIIVASWVSKMILQKRIIFKKTALDIPILAFFLSQTISTIFSIDPHISFWGYYSRFNGGLLSTITYIALYYALVSNFESDGKKFIVRLLKTSLLSGLIVTLWGLPSHFGYDPTCFLFRKTLDVACWTAAFQPKVRIFSTLGQPDWLSAYLSILIPIALTFAFLSTKLISQNSDKKVDSSQKLVASAGYFLLTASYYVALLYTKSKSSFIALLISIGFYFALLLFFKISKKIILISLIAIILINFFVPSPFEKINTFTFDALSQKISQLRAPAKNPSQKGTTKSIVVNVGELGGTDSGKIRLFVWTGALNIWKNNPIFGTGVETFAFAYYKYRPIGHNLTSEWDYLYNKAHNEYLNYLATTGIFGLGSYLAIIAIFFWQTAKLVIRDKGLKIKTEEEYIILGLLAGYFTILISNFFGFSVVIVNLYFFLIPAFVILLNQEENGQKNLKQKQEYIGSFGKVALSVIWIFAFYLEAILLNYWIADKSYALGFNLDHAGQYQTAYKSLNDAVSSRPDEPTFKDELAINNAMLAQSFYLQKDATTGAKLAQNAISLTDDTTLNHPSNVTFWKTRVRVLYALSQIDQNYISLALAAIEMANRLAPTDAKIMYNLGLLNIQSGNTEKGVDALKKAIELKSDYHEAYYALGIILHQQAIDKNNKVVNIDKEKQAVDAMHFIQKYFNNDKQAGDTLKSWGEE